MKKRKSWLREVEELGFIEGNAKDVRGGRWGGTPHTLGGCHEHVERRWENDGVSWRWFWVVAGMGTTAVCVYVVGKRELVEMKKKLINEENEMTISTYAYDLYLMNFMQDSKLMQKRKWLFPLLITIYLMKFSLRLEINKGNGITISTAACKLQFIYWFFIIKNFHK